MSTIFLTSPFHGLEFDTQAKLRRTLDTLAELESDCATDNDRSMLLMAFDIVSRIKLNTYE